MRVSVLSDLEQIFEDLTMLNTIVFAIDGSEFSQRVLQTLQQLQMQPATKIILSYVIPLAASTRELAAEQLHTDVAALPYLHIEKKLRSYQADLPVESEIEIVTGDPAEEIIRLSNIYQADLIVIGSRGFMGVKRIIQGSVSSQVVENASCSVLVVKPE